MSHNVNGTATLTVMEFASLSTGGKHSRGVTTARAAYCWGYNGYGQLGNGTNTNNNMPVSVNPE